MVTNHADSQRRKDTHRTPKHRVSKHRTHTVRVLKTVTITQRTQHNDAHTLGKRDCQTNDAHSGARSRNSRGDAQDHGPHKLVCHLYDDHDI